MYEPEVREERFEGNRGRDEFIDGLLKILENKVTPYEIDQLSDLMDEL